MGSARLLTGDDENFFRLFIYSACARHVVPFILHHVIEEWRPEVDNVFVYESVAIEKDAR